MKRAKKECMKNRGNGENAFRRRKPFTLIVELLALVFLVVAASYAPQLIFQVQDGILCGQTERGERESMDVEALSTTYELSLAKRMTNFAEGMASGDKYYVTSKELTVGQEVLDYLNSDMGLYQDMLYFLVDGALINYRFLSGMDSFEVSQWKQYVIYSDDYAKGVNFILWCIELKTPEDEIMKLLVDAETKTLYAVKTEGNIRKPKDDLRSGFTNGDALISFWYYFATAYEAVSNAEASEWVERLYIEANNQISVSREEVDGNTIIAYEKVAVDFMWANVYVKENLGFQSDINDARFTLPYGEGYLDVDIKLARSDVVYENYYGTSYYYVYPDITLGVRQIYELIPEFA